MTSFQKVIKYGAIAFGIYLCFVIVSMIVFGITAIFGITTGVGMFMEQKENSAIVTKWEQEYSNIKKIDINLSIAKLNIKKGNTLKVEAFEVSNKFQCKTEGNKLKIEDKEDRKLRSDIFDMEEVKAEVTIYVPENMSFEEIVIETGYNETNIELLEADKIELEMGAGKCQVDSILAKYAKIEAGAGETNIQHAEIEELKLDTGIGKIVLASKIIKKADISCGVGKVDLNLIGLATDYKVKAETGIGNFIVDNQKITDSQTIGNGEAVIEIDAGVGETVVNFQEEKKG